MKPLSSYLPKNHVDAVAMSFTFIMIPISYLHGVLYIAPTIWPAEGSTAEYSPSYTVGVIFMTFLFANTYSNLWLTLTKDTSCASVTSPIIAQPGWFYCPYCRFHAPPRAHHCSSCQTCILRRDHHCFFVGRCIGFHNHRYFMAFLIYLTVSAIVGVVTSFIAIVRLTGGFSFTLLPLFFFPVLAFIFQIMPVNLFIMFQTSMALFVTLAAGSLLLLQIYLIYKGQTYHEMQKNITFYSNSPMNNFRDTFGKNWWFCWLLPFVPSPRLGGGEHYPPRDSVVTVAGGASAQVNIGGHGDGVDATKKDRRRKFVQ